MFQRRPRSYLTFFCSILLVFSFVLSSVHSYGEERLKMNMRDADIRALIQWIADNTGKNIVVHKDVNAKVTVISSTSVTADEAYQVFLSVLDVHGFAAIETAQSLKIIPKNIAVSGLPLESNSRNQDMVVSIIKIEHLSAKKVASLMRPLVSTGAVLTPSEETNSLIIADHSSNIRKLRKLIKGLDKAGDTEIELITLKYANAADIMSSLTSLMPKGSGSQSLSLSTDERSNSILLSGDPAKRKQMIKLINKLDTPLAGEGNTQVVYLHYVDAKELVPILQSLAKSIQNDNKNQSSGVSIEQSESANALVINAPPAILNTMKRVISQLDIRRAQVLVEALIVEVSGDVASDIGVSWISANTNDINAGLVGSVNTLGDLPLATLTNSGFSPGRGLTFGYFENGNLQAAVRALEANQNSNVLSTPTIVAIDNEEASLLVGQNVPFKTGQSTGSSSSTNDPFTTIERQDIGISLIVTPRINRGDSITLEIKQKTESIAASVDVASDIITNKREILTKALIKDGQILVLGGLISDEETETQEKVPFLGDLPLVGSLFRSKGINYSKKNLMIFIHPVILKDEEHINEVTQKRYNFMKELRDKAVKNNWSVGQQSTDSMQDFKTFSPAP